MQFLQKPLENIETLLNLRQQKKQEAVCYKNRKFLTESVLALEMKKVKYS